jgi:hypothetical protein
VDFPVLKEKRNNEMFAKMAAEKGKSTPAPSRDDFERVSRIMSDIIYRSKINFRLIQTLRRGTGYEQHGSTGRQSVTHT